MKEVGEFEINVSQHVIVFFRFGFRGWLFLAWNLSQCFVQVLIVEQVKSNMILNCKYLKKVHTWKKLNSGQAYAN